VGNALETQQYLHLREQGERRGADQVGLCM
jgi:hypothetical protein